MSSAHFIISPLHPLSLQINTFSPGAANASRSARLAAIPLLPKGRRRIISAPGHEALANKCRIRWDPFAVAVTKDFVVAVRSPFGLALEANTCSNRPLIG